MGDDDRKRAAFLRGRHHLFFGGRGRKNPPFPSLLYLSLSLSLSLLHPSPSIARARERPNTMAQFPTEAKDDAEVEEKR